MVPCAMVVEVMILDLVYFINISLHTSLIFFWFKKVITYYLVIYIYITLSTRMHL